MRRAMRGSGGTLIGALLLAVMAMPGVASAQQASLVLENCDAKYCYTHNNLWELTKEVTGNTVDESGVGTITWTITATKDSSEAATFTVHGGLTIRNGGSAPATIGNIVVNLQKPNSPKKGSNASHVSIAANVADATSGDAATSAKIVAAGSQENMATNLAWGTGNYTTASGVGTFVETAGSGALEFTDASNNTIFSLVPQPTLPPGNSITLLYHATFSTAVLPPAGTSLRVETIVTFGRAGARGGSGAVGSNIDINGNGAIDNDEAKVRSVPCRVSQPALPAAPEECNDSVTVYDSYEYDVDTTGTVTTSNPIGFDQFPDTISDSATWDVSVDVDAGADGGFVCNTAELAGEACGGTLNVIIGYEEGLDELGNVIQIPVYATYECAAAAEASADACVDLTGDEDPGFHDGEYCGFSQGGYGGPGGPYRLLAANFAAMFPSGVEVGIPGAGGYSMTFSSATAVQAYLPDGGTADTLTADLINPTSTSSGVFGAQVLTLKLNIALSDIGATPEGFGDLYYCDETSSLHGLTIRQILAAAEVALGGGAVPDGYSYASLSGLVEDVALSFHAESEVAPGCGVSDWAQIYLSKEPCE